MGKIQYFRLLLDPVEDLGLTQHPVSLMTLAGGKGWELRVDNSVDVHRSETMNRHLICLKGESTEGVYLTRQFLDDLGVKVDNMRTTRLGALRLYPVNRNLLLLLVETLEAMPTETETERFLAERNTFIFNAVRSVTDYYGGVR